MIMLKNGFSPAGNNIDIVFHRHPSMPQHIVGDIKAAGTNPVFSHAPNLRIIALIRIVVTDIELSFDLRKYILRHSDAKIDSVRLSPQTSDIGRPFPY